MGTCIPLFPDSTVVILLAVSPALLLLKRFAIVVVDSSTVLSGASSLIACLWRCRFAHLGARLPR
jgi:hypothetical protein